MDTITITTENHETYSAVSNFFIDYYMTEANGEFVKVYLYLVRLLNSGHAVTVPDIADHFNLTQKDICRAIKYWIKEGVLRLEYTKDKVLTGITLLPLSAKNADSDSDDALLAMLGVEDEPAPAQPQTVATPAAAAAETALADEVAAIANSVSVPEKPQYKASQIEAKQRDEDFGNILYQTETYFGRQLTQTDVNSLMYISDQLEFSPELLEFLIEHCVSIGKKSCRYIESVAIDWYKDGIRTKAEAQDAGKIFNTTYVAVLRQLGIQRRVPTPAETSYIDTWHNAYAFDNSIIIEACKRAISTNPQSANFHYVNGILESWHRQNVHNLADIEALDNKWAEEKKRKQVDSMSASANQFNNYQSTTSQSVVNEFESLFLQEANQ